MKCFDIELYVKCPMGPGPKKYELESCTRAFLSISVMKHIVKHIHITPLGHQPHKILTTGAHEDET